MTKRKAIVTGASGLVGSYLIAHLLEQGGWDIVALSRRKPAVPGKYQHIAVDLTDRADVQGKLSSLKDITHVFFVAYLERSDPVELVSVNTAMLVNLVEVIEAASPVLEHVHLSEGTKWYGNHLGPFK